MVRRKPDTLWHRYSLSAMEHRRLVEMVNSPGMSQDCALYRANRFAPIALNLPEVCRALGAELRGMNTWTQNGLRYVVVGDASGSDIASLSQLLKAAS